jgi:hypothetical protein
MAQLYSGGPPTLALPLSATIYMTCFFTPKRLVESRAYGGFSDSWWGQMAAKAPTNPVLLRKNMHIGFADAEADTEFLNRCFVDTGHLGELRNTDGPKCIVIGRTGSGKTALLKRVIDSEENTSQISPEMLSLNYISNSNVIQFFE